MYKSAKSSYLVVESDIHHQHLSSDADPAGATGVVGVHAASEPHLSTRPSVNNSRCSEVYDQQAFCFSITL